MREREREREQGEGKKEREWRGTNGGNENKKRERKEKGNKTGGGEKSRLFVLVVPRGTRGSTSKAPFSAGLNPGVLINPAHLPVNALANNRRMNSSQ